MSDPAKYAADLAKTVFYPACGGVPCFEIQGREVPYWLKSFGVWDEVADQIALLKAEGLAAVLSGPAVVDGQIAFYFVKLYGTDAQKIMARGLISFPLKGHLGCGRFYLQKLVDEIAAECERLGIDLLVNDSK
jgi:hypothetical protein